MKYKFWSLFCILIMSCKSQNISEQELANNQEETFIHFFKIQSYCSCLKNSYSNKNIFSLIEQEDLLGSYDALADPEILKKIDSLGKIFSLKVKPEEYPDFKGKKRITQYCLSFYTSQELDKIAKEEFRLHVKKQKFK
ncbi:hypothetical protein Q763_16645 [Flavobacterium beibuense F44-8]|uniref:Lipoprotein n=1 Tax=Flavobacterium beibuense F44-8 TaxID=1406840 RepID=A0A0A2LRI9_9FLAO|nr:hypothetical protein [Flavobacterium beibuense]KGO78815.1 hypothetical protein Q763_16645 [Flavobacterium beibuense F44-8]